MTEIPAPLPFHVSVQGARVYISVRDAFHLERERDFKRQIRLAHPDHNHHCWACSRTRQLLRARCQFEAEDARWYANYGLEPPHRAVRLVSNGFARSGPLLGLPVEREMQTGLVVEKESRTAARKSGPINASQASPEAA